MLPADLADLPIDHAVRGGHDADRLGVAFVAGYGAALRALVPGAPARTSLCATEDAGAHPRAIATTLADGRLRGRKTWSTLATEAELLLVVASVGVDAAGKNRLRLVRVAPTAPGVTITPMPPPPFAPEVGHAALLGWMLGLAARHAWPRELVERLLAAVATLRSLAAAPPLAPQTHVALAGAIALTRELAERAPWDTLPPDALARWQRDRPLLDVAGRARAARLDAAWQRLG
jgi:acyl-CoA dehydrogenase